MSILKSIMHHWNKTTNSYDILHPETESSQITDWHSGIMASLASKTLGTVVDAVTTDSVLGKLIKMLLNASGVKYLINTNGYICFGDFFGGLIIQWINTRVPADALISLPIAAGNEIYSLLTTIKATRQIDGDVAAYAIAKNLSSVQITLDWDSTSPGPMDVMLVAICR